MRGRWDEDGGELELLLHALAVRLLARGTTRVRRSSSHLNDASSSE